MTDKHKVPESLKKKIADIDYTMKLENLAKQALTRDATQPALVYSDLNRERDIREKPMRHVESASTSKNKHK